MTASTPRFDFAMWGLVDDHPEYQYRDMGWTSHHATFWYGSDTASGVGPGVLVRSYNPAGLIRDRDDEPPWNTSGVGPWTGHSLWSIFSQACRELSEIAELKEAMRHKHPVMRDTLMLIDGTCVPAVAWDVCGPTTGGYITVSASLLTHPVSVISWRGGVPSPITLEALSTVTLSA